MKIFWAWQSDHPGIVSRHFVRDALEDAIAKLKEARDIEEPSEEARRDQLHLDSDRQGLSGSPDLARAILAKIDASSVFIGDVTPIGSGPALPADAASAGRPVMNPNVAIELGYALARLSDARVLMILNMGYGTRDSLPFDLRHKAGPIIYELAPDAAKQEIAVEKAKLVAKLVEAVGAIKPIETQTAPLFRETQPEIGKAFFFKDKEVLGRSQHTDAELVMPFRSVFYLRIIPTRPLRRPLSVDLLVRNAGRYGAFGGDGEELIRENEYGVAIISPAGNSSNIDSLAQYFRNGEIWGINADILRQGERGRDRWLISRDVEKTIAESLNLFVEFLRDVTKIEAPYTVEAGLHGVKGRKLVNSGSTIGNAKIADDCFDLRRVLHNASLSTQDEFLLEFFELMHDQTGHPRPHGLYGFPPDRKL